MVDVIANIPIAVIVAVLVGLLRSVTGWLENALKDGVIDAFEYRQLAGTIIHYVAAIILLVLGVENALPIIGVDAQTASAAAVPVSASVAYILDLVTSALKKAGIGVTSGGQQ